MHFNNIGLTIPTILFPNKDIDLTKWAVIACDQYTSQPEYWEKVKKTVGESPSTLNLIYPEVYLESENRDQITKTIHENMKKYIQDGVIVPQKPGFILVDRKTAKVETRKGLIVSLDLEKYDYSKGAQTLIRATEGTIIERLPPRIKIRENSIIELPHIMVLIDDPERTVIEPLFEMQLEKICDFDLMMNSGHIKAYRIDNRGIIDEIAKNIAKLADINTFNKKYNVSGKGVLLYAMGDGNHSLAAAKAIWENIKAKAEDKTGIMDHPARFSLVELVNVHDEGIVFEPIHRVVFNVNPEYMLRQMEFYYKGNDSDFSYKTFRSREETNRELPLLKGEGTHNISFVTKNMHGIITVKNPALNLEVGTLQSFLDKHLKENNESKIDYIHGEEVVASLGLKSNNIGFYMPAMSKHDLFKTVILDGALPRKTFSMGEADEKRFYLECRQIIP
jgi:uncharacterized protein (DUF1015 family)